MQSQSCPVRQTGYTYQVLLQGAVEKEGVGSTQILKSHGIDEENCLTDYFEGTENLFLIIIEYFAQFYENYLLASLKFIFYALFFSADISNFQIFQHCLFSDFSDGLISLLLFSCFCPKKAIDRVYCESASWCSLNNDLFELVDYCSKTSCVQKLKNFVVPKNPIYHVHLYKLQRFLGTKLSKNAQAGLTRAHSASSGESLLILNQNSVHTVCWVNRNVTSPLARKNRRVEWIFALPGNTKRNLTGCQGNFRAFAIGDKSSFFLKIEGVYIKSGTLPFGSGQWQDSGLCSSSIKKSLDDNEPGVIEKVFAEETNCLKLMQPNFDPKDFQHRLSTFRGQGNTWVSGEDFAAGGFYVTQDGIVTCFSCRIIHHIEDFVNGNPSSAQWHEVSCSHILETRPIRFGRLASDGQISDDINDPPGQQSIYIPPGDIWKEAYRLSTFEHFPIKSLVSRKSLAKSGFYFTGYHDRVKCFACARTVQQWVETDNPADNKWHKPSCPLPKGEECGNVPLPNLFGALLPVAKPMNGASNSSATRRANPAEEVLEQRDPNTGALIRRVRYPSDLPERIRQTGGTFEIGPNNQVIIRSGPGPAPRNPAHIGLGSTAQQPRRPWRMANVVSADHRRFLTNLYLNRELDRLATFARWPVGRPNIAPAYLAKSGFFYLGDMDRTQCFSCGGVLRNWKLEDDADAEHRAHFPQCQMILGIEDRNIPVHEHPEAEDERERKYPCRFPSNPHMRSENSRQATFDQRWPMRRTAATPAEIAQAGFFFLGERDRAKCWYCNGGLQNWDYDDIPWIEHAKWFPNCQFLLRVKGQHFVYRHLAMNPHLARPVIARQDGSPLENVGQAVRSSQEPQRSLDVPPSIPRVNQPEPTPIIIDPQVEMRQRKERVKNLMQNSEIVRFVISMGFDSKTVAAVLEDRINAGDAANANQIYESASDLLDDVSKKEEEERQNQAAAMAISASAAISPVSSITSGATGMTPLTLAPGLGKYNVSYNDDDDERMDQDLYGSMEGTSASPAKQLHCSENDPESLRQALDAINEEKLCKICFSNQADMVFVPCSHLCCCMECTQAITQCPICRKPIQKAIKTYIN